MVLAAAWRAARSQALRHTPEKAASKRPDFTPLASVAQQLLGGLKPPSPPPAHPTTSASSSAKGSTALTSAPRPAPLSSPGTQPLLAATVRAGSLTPAAATVRHQAGAQAVAGLASSIDNARQQAGAPAPARPSGCDIDSSSAAAAT